MKSVLSALWKATLFMTAASAFVKAVIAFITLFR
jgi:hypothetical protein